MFDNLSYKQKNKLLIVVAVLLMILMYRFAISNTLQLSESNEELKLSIAKGESAPTNILKVKAQLIAIDKQLNRYLAKSTLDNEYLLEVVSDYCQKNKVILREFPGVDVNQEQTYEVLTNEFVVEGDFESINKLLYTIEVIEQVGRISSAEYFIFKDRERRKMVLRAKVVVQKLKIQGDEIS